MQCQELAPKTNAGNQPDTISELCEQVWKRWQLNEFPLLQPTECKDGQQMNLAHAITACLTEEVKPAIRDFIARKHQQQYQITAEDQNRETLAQSEFCGWLQKNYYAYICEYLIQHFIKTTTLPHRIVNGTFHPFFTPANYQAEAVAQLTNKQVATTIATKLEEIDKHLKREWTQICDIVGLGSTHDQVTTATAFFADNYINYLMSVVDADTKRNTRTTSCSRLRQR